MRSLEERKNIFKLAEQGLNKSEISRELNIPRATVRDILASGRKEGKLDFDENDVLDFLKDKEPPYAYILGIYLGDGCISNAKRVKKMRIFLDDKYPLIQQEVRENLQNIFENNKVSDCQKEGCKEIFCYSKKMEFLFPQYGKGKKHQRKISLKRWQHDICCDFPKEFIKGLIHSDGSRYHGDYKGERYDRYQFTNVSEDIRKIFRKYCKKIGVRTANAKGAKNVFINRPKDVGYLDTFIGFKA